MKFCLHNLNGMKICNFFRRNTFVRLFAGIFALTSVTNFASGMAVSAPSVVSKSEFNDRNTNFRLTKRQVVEDVSYVLERIKENHFSAIDKIPDEVSEQAEQEIENLEDEVTLVEEWRALLRIISKLHDSHTSLIGPAFLNKRLPFDTEYNGGKIICTSGEFKGCAVTAINDISIEELYKIFKNHCPREIDEYAEFRFFEEYPDSIPATHLAVCGVDIFKPVKVSFTTKSGIESRVFDTLEVESRKADTENPMFYEINKENSVAVLTLNKCCYNDRELWDRTILCLLGDISRENIKNVVVDLRNNPGGNLFSAAALFPVLTGVGNFKGHRTSVREKNDILYGDPIISFGDIIEQSPIPLFTGNVFILTSRATFSTAVDIATIFADNNKATIVGEIPGGAPTSFGFNTPDFYLPNGGLTFYMTCGKIERPDETKDGTKLIPDIQVPAKDALNRVYEIIAEEGKQ